MIYKDSDMVIRARMNYPEAQSDLGAVKAWLKDVENEGMKYFGRINRVPQLIECSRKYFQLNRIYKSLTKRGNNA